MSQRNHATPVHATPVAESEWTVDGPPGAFCFPADPGDLDGAPRRLWSICPCGCGTFMDLPVRVGAKQAGAWLWDGDAERPTVDPSIRDLAGCRFHGWLRGGTWTFEPDSGQGATR